MSKAIQQKLGAVRNKLSLVSAATGVAVGIGGLVLALALQMLLDFYLELGWSLRAVLLAIDLAGLAFVLVRFIILPTLMGPDDEDVALMVERRHPDFRTRLIATVQLTQPGAIPAGASPLIVRAMVAETERMAQPLDFTRVVPVDRMVKASVAAVALVVLGVVAFAWARPSSGELLKRVFLGTNPVPRQTRVELLSGNNRIARGDGVLLVAKAHGVVPASGRVKVRFDSGKSAEFLFDPDNTEPSLFSRRIDNVQDSFAYTVYLNDGHSDSARVQLLERPVLKSIACAQVYPAYTNLGEERRSTADLGLLAGSRLKFEAWANKAIRSAEIRLHGVALQPIPMSAGGSRLTGEIAIDSPDIKGFSVHLNDADGIASRDESVYRIDVLPDKDPQVTMTWPQNREELVTQSARILMAFAASDDYGIGKVFLHFRIDKLEGGREQTRELEVPPGTGKFLKSRYELDLGKLPSLPPEGSVVEYWIEVQDRNTLTPRDRTVGVGREFTEHFTARVVSREEKDADLKSRINEYFGRIDMMTKDQETLNEQLGKIILEKK